MLRRILSVHQWADTDRYRRSTMAIAAGESLTTMSYKQTLCVRKPFLSTAPRCRAAFTLIELLVVIAIIAILAAILFPVFAQARDKARQTACLSNAKHIGTAVMMYVQDSDEMFPSVHFSKYLVLIQPYAKNEELWKCPNESGRYRMEAAAQVYNPSVARDIDISWGANGAVFGGWNDTATKPLSRLQEPAETVMLAETLVRNPAPTTGNVSESAFDACQDVRHVWWHRQYNGNVGGTFPYGAAGGGRLAARHARGNNFLWGDGHAKWVREPVRECRAWSPTFPAGQKRISDSYTNIGCRPDGETVNWCFNN
jgi:prepilin-type N-terminal cleavage/methylation domain-containing protein/prepilin-type processing-associated H-X9-DG protein